MPERPAYILPAIVLSQFAGTSLWFAGNAVLPDLQQLYALPETAVGNITSAVQLGFITGTLTFAFLLIADRFSPSRVFMVSALLGAFFNWAIYGLATGFATLLIFRFFTGFFLAGIYPIGMKIASDWYEKGLGKALGYLVGALVLGKAFPYFLKYQIAAYPWYSILIATSAFAAFGGLLIGLFVPDGPNRKRSSQFKISAIAEIFRYPRFRSAAFGYFGHMWELYAFWAFIPVFLLAYQQDQALEINYSFWSSAIIATGFLGCVLGGYYSLRLGSGRVAYLMLLTSGLFCLLSPLLFALPQPLFLLGMIIWGFAVVGDSPQFSTLVARTAPREYIGSALTIVNCIGFTITIFSIELLNLLALQLDERYLYLALLAGPVFGLWAIRRVVGEANVNV